MADTTTTTNTSTSTNSNLTAPSNEEMIAKINEMYDKNAESQKANLEQSYQNDLATAQQNKANIATNYADQKNQLAAEYERQRANNNLSAIGSGLNSGAGSQMALSQQANYNSNQAKLSKAQAQAETEADTNMATLTKNYQLQVNEAVANNDYQRAAALLDEYNNQKSDAATNAQNLAQYGDFSGYASLYGQETADAMARTWAMMNPAVAYAMGKITANEYKALVGTDPATTITPTVTTTT